MAKLKITNNIDLIEDEISNQQFNINLEDHILQLKSFIDPEWCKNLIIKLENRNDLDKSTPYTDGLLNDQTDSYFDPDIEIIESIKNKIFKDGLKQYAERIRCFNWAYHESEHLYPSEMIIRRYHNQSEFKYHYDDIIEEIFPHWFKRRKNVLTCNIYLNDNIEYDGGELHFASCDKTYNPSVGDVIISPSNWMFYHKVKKIESGIRYSGTFWIYYGSNLKIKKGRNHSEKFLKC
jgi:hypothetical protein